MELTLNSSTTGTILDQVSVSMVSLMKGLVLVQCPPLVKKLGQIHLPDMAAEPPCTGTVLVVPDDPDCPLAPGDLVIFQSGSSTPLKLENREDLAFLEYGKEFSGGIIGWVPREMVPLSEKDYSGGMIGWTPKEPDSSLDTESPGV